MKRSRSPSQNEKNKRQRNKNERIKDEGNKNEKNAPVWNNVVANITSRGGNADKSASDMASALALPSHRFQRFLLNSLGTPILTFSKPHTNELLAIDASNSQDGMFAIGGMDRIISVWKLFEDEEQHEEEKQSHKTCFALRGHKNAVTSIRLSKGKRFSNQVQSDGLSRNQMVSTSADGTHILWDLNMMKMKKKYRGHESIVNEVALFESHNSMEWCTASDDGTVLLWNENEKQSAQRISIGHPVISVDATSPGDARNSSGVSVTRFACAGLDGFVYVYDIRRLFQPLLILDNHKDTITSVKFNAEQNRVASFSMDHSIHIWDVNAYSIYQNRLEKKLYGPTHGMDHTIRLSWSEYDTHLLACGSVDNLVYVFDTLTGKMMHKLKGHTGCVNDVKFHPEHPILMSVSTDGTCIVGDLE